MTETTVPTETPELEETPPPQLEETPPQLEETPPQLEETPPQLEETPPQLEETSLPQLEETAPPEQDETGQKRTRRGRGWWWAFALAVVVLVGAALRLRGADWDAGHHLHPDERFLTMVEGRLELPQDLLGYLDTDTSPLNPRNRDYSFFVYGTLPITLVQLVARELEGVSPPLPPEMAESGRLSDKAKGGLAWLATGSTEWPGVFTDYSRVNLVGRRVVAYLDTLTILALFALGFRLYGKRTALLAATLGAFTAFHIQQAHFFTVDAPANFFVVVTLVGLAGLSGGRRWWDPILAGVAMGCALASKISVWPLVPLAVIAAISGYGPSLGGGLRGTRAWARVALAVLVVGVCSFATLRLAQPDMWAGPGWPNVVENPDRFATVTMEAPHWWQTLHDGMPDALEPLLLPDPRWAANMAKIQSQITGHGMDWPPNHQWFGRLAYWFPWKNMVLWGMGLALGITAWTAWGAAGVGLVRGDRRHLVPWLWVAMTFAYFGIQWAKTMRYYLPLYPALIVLGAWALVAWLDRARAPASEDRQGAGLIARVRQVVLHPVVPTAAIAVVVGATAVWGLMVSNIYGRDHSRVAGSRWLYHQVPAGFALRVNQTEGETRSYLPFAAPSSVAMRVAGDAGSPLDAHSYVLADNREHDPARVIIPGDRPVTVDGLYLSNMSDPAGDAAPETLTVDIVDTPYPTEESILASGRVETALERAPSDVLIPFEPVELEPGGEYYVRIGVDGAPVAGRLPVLALETRWDDVIPLGLDGYAAFDDAGTAWAEGMFGSHMLEMFGEDEATKVDEIVDGLAQSDYFVITSNRTYGSVAQLPTRFPMTNRFYDLLFSGEAGYDHVAEITSYPGIGPLEVPDQAAEEAWHVYDHPRVDVFKRSPDYDPDALRAELIGLTDPSVRTWTWPTESGFFGKITGALGALGGGGEPAAAERAPLSSVMLSSDRFEDQRTGGTWRDVFNPESIVNRSPVVSVLVWYAVLALLGLLAFPIVALGLGDLADRGWAVSRTAGLLIASWMGWLAASTGLVPHTPLLVWLCVAVLGAAGAFVYLRAGRNHDLRAWVRSHWRLLLFEEVLLVGLFAVFLVIRMGNPDLWHPWYGGEKPMDFAYLNAVLKTRSFPPYDPWFAGGTLNYYYYGFVFVGALIELTGVVPSVAYNLAIPTLAALTGIGVFGVAHAWSVRLGRSQRTSAGAGVLAAVLAVLAGNLFQVKMIVTQLGTLGHVWAASAIPGVESAQRAISGWLQIARNQAELGMPTGHWYWNASRAIAVPPTDVQPITEFPFFTFLYADLHAHMMALPITVLALAAALSWPMSWTVRWNGFQVARGATRMFIAALAIGALWPANTWDFPTYGLVAAGAIAIAHWGRRPRISLSWAVAVGAKGAALLGLSLLLFLPYHLNYVQPYSDFSLWKGARTQVGDYLIVHGIALFAVASWVAWRAWAASELEARLPGGRKRVAAYFLAVGLVGAALAAAGEWLVLVALAVAAGGSVLTLRRGALPAERFAGWVIVLGVALTLFVEFVVLQGDIGRMNTVFKFYIQVWVLWAALAGVGAAWLAPHLARLKWGGAWWGVFAVLVASGLVYTATATRGKWTDRFPVMGTLDAEERAAYEMRWRPGLSGIEYEDYARYDDDGFMLRLKDDADGIRWMQENVEGTPVILEAFREKGYRWGSRYSIQTGLPTVIGWDWHQTQQRNAVGGEVVQARTADVRDMFDTTDLEHARDLLRFYLVDYVVVGELERAFYSADGLAKFDKMVDSGDAEVAYQHPDGPLTIYRILRSGEPAGAVPGLAPSEIAE